MVLSRCFFGAYGKLFESRCLCFKRLRRALSTKLFSKLIELMTKLNKIYSWIHLKCLLNNLSNKIKMIPGWLRLRWCLTVFYWGSDGVKPVLFLELMVNCLKAAAFVSNDCGGPYQSNYFPNISSWWLNWIRFIDLATWIHLKYLLNNFSKEIKMMEDMPGWGWWLISYQIWGSSCL